MSLETRSNSALYKRAEQLKRWEESDTNREPVSPKQKSRKVKFSSGCVFLAACSAGDKEEVLKLLDKGADINTANVDGLTALHQACIDDNLDMVEFLVEHGADVNRGDNEGWTPLHATSSCGFVYIAKFLIEKGANVAAVNNDGELAIDIADSQKMEDLLKEEIRKRGIDCDAARNDEENLMLRDAKEWLATKSSLVNEPHPKTGATALHVAAAKGYIDVMKILLQSSGDIDAQDSDGWTPLHAAAHWGQNEASRLLVENLADMDAKNFVGQTAFDLADTDMFGFLDDLRKKQNKEEVNKRKAKKRAEEEVNTIDTENQTQVKKVKVEITGANEETKNSEIDMEVSSESESDSESETETSEESECSTDEDEKKNRVNSQTINDKIAIKEQEIMKPPPVPPKNIENTEEKMPWRQPIKPKPELNSPDKSTSNLRDFKHNASDLNNENTVAIRRTKSFQNDELFYAKYKALHARIQANNDSNTTYNTNPSARPKSDIILTTSRTNKEEKNNDVSTSTADSALISVPTKTTSPNTSPQAVNNQSAFRSGLKLALDKAPPTTNGSSAPTGASTPPTTSATTPTTPTTPGGTRSFVPPVRDEESETQRKAHAKRVRETRRSTQGVTLEEIKSAEQLVKLKNQPNNNNDSSGGGESVNPTVSVSVTISTGTPTVVTRSDTTTAVGGPIDSSSNGGSSEAQLNAPNSAHERRPSWRLKVDGSSKFKLEDATKPETPETPPYVRRLNPASTITQRPTSAPIDTAETTVTIPLRRPKSLDEKDQDKENDVRNAQATLATQAAIQRRRRPKRRSTGVVSFDNMEDMDQEKDPSAGGDATEMTKLNSQEQPVPPTRHRSSSAVRSGSNSYGSRPRSVGYYGSNSNPYSGSSPYSSPYSNGTGYSSLNSYNSNYGSSYQSPYFPNGYRGASGAGGYASLTIPAKALSSVNALTQNYPKSYENNYLKNDNGRRSRRDLSRGNSYRERSASRSMGSLPGSGMGPRSISLTSLNSEGYFSGSERSSRSRISSLADIRNENGEIDYKKLYEDQLVENERLKDKLRKSDEELRDTKQTLEKINVVTSKNSLSELEKRERRAMERKLSEMEEELKNLENLKNENQRLKDENGALIRVISKLSK